MPLILNYYLLYLIIMNYLNISLYLFSKKSEIINNYAVNTYIVILLKNILSITYLLNNVSYN